jgi:AAA family ATPase
MSNTQDMQKTLEVKIRPYSNQNNQERPDQKGISRVHMCKEALMDLGLQPGQAISLWKKDESTSLRRDAVAWLTAEKNLSKKVVQMSKTFQEVCGFKLADDLVIGAAGNVTVAESITLRDITEGSGPVSELGSEDKPHWEWYLRENLGRSCCLVLHDKFSCMLSSPSRLSYSIHHSA